MTNPLEGAGAFYHNQGMKHPTRLEKVEISFERCGILNNVTFKQLHKPRKSVMHAHLHLAGEIKAYIAFYFIFFEFKYSDDLF